MAGIKTQTNGVYKLSCDFCSGQIYMLFPRSSSSSSSSSLFVTTYVQ